MVARALAGKAAISSSAVSGNVLRIGGVVVGPAPNPHTRDLAGRAPTALSAKTALARRRPIAAKAATAASAKAAVTTSTGGGIDLTVTNLTAAPASPTAGQAMTFTVTVRNGGTAPVPAGRAAGQNIGVGIYLDGAATPVTFTNFDGGLAPGATFTLDTTTGWAPGGAWVATVGTHTVRAFVDDQNLISETNESNNTRDITITVALGAIPVLGERLYADTSPWNTVKSSSGPFFAGADAVLASQTYGLNNDAFSHPFYIAQATDPVWTINQTAQNWGWGPRAVHIHAPDGIAPASGSDSVMTVLDIDGTLWDFYGVGGGVNQAAHTVSTPLLNTSDGINGRGFPDVGSTGFQTPGTSISGAPQASGTVLARDVAAQTIPHGLFMAFDCAQLGAGASGTDSVAPAMAGITDSGGCPGLIPEGALLLAVGTEPGGLNLMQHQLWLAASTYGVFVCDRLGGHPQFYGDRSPEVANALSPGGDISALTAIGRKLRLVHTW